MEAVEALYQRAIDFIRYLQNNFPDRRIIAIGHGAFNRAIIAYLEGKKAIEMIDLPIMENTTRVYFKI